MYAGYKLLENIIHVFQKLACKALLRLAFQGQPTSASSTPLYSFLTQGFRTATEIYKAAFEEADVGWADKVICSPFAHSRCGPACIFTVADRLPLRSMV